MISKKFKRLNRNGEVRNNSWRKKVLQIAPLLVCGVIGSIIFADQVSAHGYIHSSRAALCKDLTNKNCGPVQYEPQSVEGLGTFPAKGPADGQIAGAGVFPQLDEQTASRWSKVTMNGGKNTIKWTLTAPHATREWKYYITKKDWNPDKPLARADLELIETFNDGGAKPSTTVVHQINVPTDRSGYHVILGVWEIADTVNAFYQVMDVNLINDDNGNPNPEDTTAPTAPTAVTSPVQTTNTVELRWNAASDNVGVSHYDIYRNGVKVQTVTGTSVVDTGLEANTSYTYTVMAVDAAGNVSKESAAITVTTKPIPVDDTTAPTAPTSLHTMGQTTSTINLMWNASTDNVGVKHYEVYRNGVKVQTVTGTMATDSGLQPNTEYTYYVKAVDAAGNVSDASNSITVKTKEQPTGQLPEWESAKVYTSGNRVLFQGIEYEAKWWTQGDQPDTSDAWKLLNSSKTPVWNASKAYNGGDRVIYEGVTYQAKWWTQGNVPSKLDVWQVVQ